MYIYPKKYIRQLYFLNICLLINVSRSTFIYDILNTISRISIIFSEFQYHLDEMPHGTICINDVSRSIAGMYIVQIILKFLISLFFT